MYEDMELPEICKKYDEVSDLISTYKADIESLESEVFEKTEKIKEYLQILKTGADARINKEPTLTVLENGAIGEDITLDNLSYYRRKVAELNRELLKIDDEIQINRTNLQDYYKELEEIKKLIPGTGMVRIYYHGLTFLMSAYVPWITKEQWETDYKHRSGYYRLV